MVKVKLFQQKPKVEKFKPLPITRAVDSIDLDRKEELEKFRRWLEGTAKRKSKLPKKRELDKLNKEVKSGRANKFGLLGILGALPLVGPLLGFGGALASLSVGAISAIGGGLLTAGGLAIGGGLKLFGIAGAGIVGGTRLLGAAGRKLFGGGKKGPGKGGGLRGFSRPGAGASPGVKPQTSATPNRPASSPSRSTAAGNQNRGGGQQYRNNLNRSQQTGGGTTQPRRPSARARFGAGLETGTNFGGRGSGAQKKLFKLQQRMKKLFSGKNPLQGFMGKIFGTKAGRSAIGKFLQKFVVRIPFIGALIDFAMRVFIFKEHPGPAAFKAIGAGIGAGLLGAVLSIIPGIGTIVGAIGGGYIGDKLGGWLYDRIFGAPDPAASAPEPKDDGNILDDLFGGGEEDGEAPPAPELPAPGEPPGQPLRGRGGGLANIVPTANLERRGVYAGDNITNQVGYTSGRGRRWDRHHAGVDIGVGPGNPSKFHVAFAMSGQVTVVGNYGTYGNLVVITAGGKDFTFAHLKDFDVRKGQAYTGQIIGEIGKTGGGNTTSEHLHFEVAPPGKGGLRGFDQDPMPYVKYLRIGTVDPNATGGVDTVNSDSQSLTPQIPAQPGQMQEQPKSFVEQLTDMLPESAKGAVSSVIESFKIFGYMADKDLMDSLVVNPDGSVSKKAPEPVQKDIEASFTEGVEMDIMDSIGIPQMDLSVEMLSPEAEALLNNSILIMQGQPPVQAMSGGGDSPIAIAPQQPQQPVLVLGGHQDALAAVKLLQAHALS
jgi:hypothetical protein